MLRTRTWKPSKNNVAVYGPARMHPDRCHRVRAGDREEAGCRVVRHDRVLVGSPIERPGRSAAVGCGQLATGSPAAGGGRRCTRRTPACTAPSTAVSSTFVGCGIVGGDDAGQQLPGDRPGLKVTLTKLDPFHVMVATPMPPLYARYGPVPSASVYVATIWNAS